MERMLRITATSLPAYLCADRPAINAAGASRSADGPSSLRSDANRPGLSSRLRAMMRRDYLTDQEGQP